MHVLAEYVQRFYLGYRPIHMKMKQGSGLNVGICLLGLIACACSGNTYVSCRGHEVRAEAWLLRRLITIFAKMAKRPHAPRDPGVRDLFRASGIPVPQSD